MGKGQGYFTNYPKCVFCILGNEFCERFSFYGMKAILVMYLNRALLYDEDTSTVIYHTFNCFCYFMPILGAMIADGWLGKYKTILYISMVYALGNVTMAATAVPYGGYYRRWGAFLGLFLIAFGTGGIKPCVSSFGGDQFNDDQKRQKESFFSIFYMAINIGSLLSTIITPYLRSEVYCFDDNCYSLAFGVPAVLMIVAIVFFVAGTKYYRIIPPGENIIGKMFGCTGVALKGKMCGSKKRDHWLDHADHKYDKTFIEDLKSVMSVCWLFIPLPVFWALFEQQGSRWTLQAGQMDGDFGSFVLQPDQIHAVNPLLVIILVPILESVIYPCFDKLHIPNRPLQRMGVGMMLAGISFVIAGFLQIGINNGMPAALEDGMVKFKYVNAASCQNVGITANIDTDSTKILLYGQSADYIVTTVDEGESTKTLQVTATSDCFAGNNIIKIFQLQNQKAYIFVVTADDILMFHQEHTSRTQRGQSSSWIINTLGQTVDVDMQATGGQESKPREFHGIQSMNHSASDEFPSIDYYVNLLKVGTTDIESEDQTIGLYSSHNGAVYTVVIQKDQTNSKYVAIQHTDVTKNNVNILIQIPQYFVMTLGECLFSVTGLSFAYSQAPLSMKAVLQAIWLLTSAFGNLIVIIVAEINSNMTQVGEFFMFAGLMFVTVAIFIVMSMMYTYVDGTGGSIEVEVESEEKGHENNAYEVTVLEEEKKGVHDKPVVANDIEKAEFSSL